MPSPIGHSLAGIAAGWAVGGVAASPRRLRVQAMMLAALGAGADLDLLIGRHRAEAHSIGAAAIVAIAAAIWRWPVAPADASRLRIWLTAFAAWASHPLLDALAIDPSPPIGVMAWWPFSRTYVQTGLSLFTTVNREWRHAYFWTHDAYAALREMAILVPCVALVWWVRRPRQAYT